MKKVVLFLAFYLIAFCPVEAVDNFISPPQGVAPIFYLMHDSPYYVPPEGAGALGGWFWVEWKNIHPRINEFNWSSIDTHLARESVKETRLKNGQTIKKPLAISVIVQRDVDGSAVPPWIMEQITGSTDPAVWKQRFPAPPSCQACGNQTNIEKCYEGSAARCNCSPDFRPPWENEFFRQQFNEMVAAFGRKYNNDPRVNSVWIATGVYGENVTTAASSTGRCSSWDEATNRCYPCRFNYEGGGNFTLWSATVIGTYRQAFPTKPLLIIGTAPTNRLLFVNQALNSNPVVGIKHNSLEYDLPGQILSGNDGQYQVVNHYWSELAARGQENLGILGYEHFYLNAESHTYLALLAGLSRGMTLIDLPPAHLDVVALMQKKAEQAGITESATVFPMWSFVEDHFARKAENTPSVWIVLRETTFAAREGEPGDWEFYLYRPENIPGQHFQRSVGQADTVAVFGNELPGPAKEKDQLPGRWGTGTCRRTDQATDNLYMKFIVDSRWPALATTGFDIEVTYLDKGTDAWNLRYGASEKDKVIIHKQGTDRFIRKKISLPNLSLRPIDSGGHHFHIEGRGDGDEYIHMVRVIPQNWQAPKWDFDGKADTTNDCEGASRTQRAKGDFNFDYLVNLIDYNYWVAKYVRAENPTEDLSCSEGAGIQDFSVWANNYQSSLK